MLRELPLEWLNWQLDDVASLTLGMQLNLRVTLFSLVKQSRRIDANLSVPSGPLHCGNSWFSV
jgi:hypothetical protein